MSDIKSYVIDKVLWHTRRPGNPESREQIHKRFKVVINLFQDLGLMRRTILEKDSIIDDDTTIHSDDLTEEGMLVMKKCYNKWLGKVDRGMDPEDVSVFEKFIRTLRST